MKNFTNKIKYIPFIVLLAMSISSAPKTASAECWLDVGPDWMNCDPGESSNDGDYDPSDLYGNGNNGGNDDDDLNVITMSAINIDEDSGTMRGQITEIDSDEDYVRFFEWGTASNDLDHTSTMSGTTDDEGTFSMTISGLNDDDTYYYRACAENIDNSNDDDCGSVYYFTTDNDSSDDDDNDDDDGDVLGASDGNVITTDATNVTATSATLNGVVTNDGGESTTVWFEYGPTTSLGFITSTHTVYAQESIVSSTVYGLIPGHAYFFRLVSNDEQGDYKAFVTNTGTVTTSTGTITTNNNNNNTSNTNTHNTQNTGEVIFETIQYLKVELVPSAKDVRPGEPVAFEAVYENLSDRNLHNIVMVIDFPTGLTPTDAGPGKFISSQKIEVVIPALPAYTKGNFGVNAVVGAKVPDETFLVTVFGATFDHPVDQNDRVETLNSAIIRVSSLAASRINQGANVLGSGFFPTTFLGWMILAAAIALLVYISRKLYKEREEEKKKKEAHHPELKIVRS